MHSDLRRRQGPTGRAGAPRRAAALAHELLWISDQMACHRHALIALATSAPAGRPAGPTATSVQPPRDRPGQRDRAAGRLLQDAEEDRG